jgi:hypothetical protein
MTPVLDSVLSSAYGSSLGNDFFGFAKRVYTRDWSTHTADITSVPLRAYSPVATYSVYPVNSSKTLPHYSFAYYDFTTSDATSLTISINKSSGIKTALFKNGSEIPAEASGASYVIGPFGKADKVVLLIANATSTDGHSVSFSTQKSNLPGDCNFDGTVTIAEVQSSINMFLGLKAVESCVDQDGSNSVSIAEVQKVINSFLGL